MPDPVLIARGVEAGYGSRQILHGVDLDVGEGEVVALLGANGSGKSTLLNALSGFVRPRRGSILLSQVELAGLRPHRIFRYGIVQVSQARDLFPEMTVEENLRLGAWVRRGDMARLLDTVYQSFPRLAERRSQMVRLMSGGEQQMVAIGRALMSQPILLLLDEPSGGLAPAFVSEIATIVAALKRQRVTMMMVEQNIRLALSVADRILVLRDGVVIEQQDVRGGSTDEEQIVRQIYL
ncbi:MAG TPA: ABC transporter ATP-binding protein [Acetobacteraceae bacterium]|jgi:branched-chain amino acid transport system ATP-binding protein|nr:ABC transporter ATP-binding protein [Acetobacteraceae bacterium]